MIGLLALAGPGAARAQQALPSSQCLPERPIAAIAELPEASGLALSRRVPGRLWAQNDSGQPVLVALDSRGSVTGRLRLSGATVGDWEAVAVGPCPTGSCLYVADIGDNKAKRPQITIYRAPEPAGSEESVAVSDTFHAVYPEGARDAEALLVTSEGDLFIVTKGRTGPVDLYRFPRELKPGATHQLTRVGAPRGSVTPQKSHRITDGTVSTDGRWVLLRSNQSLTFHRTTDLVAGNWEAVRRVDLRVVGEAQGEGVAMDADGTVYLSGEGGGKSRPGTFARFRCTVGP